MASKAERRRKKGETRRLIQWHRWVRRGHEAAFSRIMKKHYVPLMDAAMSDYFEPIFGLRALQEQKLGELYGIPDNLRKGESDDIQD